VRIILRKWKANGLQIGGRFNGANTVLALVALRGLEMNINLKTKHK
jgi:hypothetical protein